MLTIYDNLWRGVRFTVVVLESTHFGLDRIVSYCTLISLTDPHHVIVSCAISNGAYNLKRLISVLQALSTCSTTYSVALAKVVPAIPGKLSSACLLLQRACCRWTRTLIHQCRLCHQTTIHRTTQRSLWVSGLF